MGGIKFLLLSGNNAWVGDLLNVLVIIFSIASALSVVWAIYLGIRLATASDEGKRAAAKKRLFNGLAALLIIALLTGVLVALEQNGFGAVTPPEEVHDEYDPGVVGTDNGGGGGGGGGGGTSTPWTGEQGELLSFGDDSNYALKQGSKACKKTAEGMMWGIMYGQNPNEAELPAGQSWTTNTGAQASRDVLQNAINAQTNKDPSILARDGKEYTVLYDSDETRKSREVVIGEIETSLTNNVPITVMTKREQHGGSLSDTQHWVVVTGKNPDGTYRTLNPATGGVDKLAVDDIGSKDGRGGTIQLRPK